MKKIIGVDLDEVLSETLDAVLAYHQYTFNGIPIQKSEITNFFIHRMPKYHSSPEYSFHRFVEYFLSNQGSNLQPVMGAYEVLMQLKKQGYHFCVVTGRPSLVQENTLQWLSQYFDGIFDKVIFANDLTPNAVSKSSLCKQQGIFVMIEDNLDYARELAHEGIKVYLLDKPWNQEYDPVLDKNIIKIKRWDELLAFLA